MESLDFLSLAAQRQSCRSYDKTRPIEREKLLHIIEIGRLAPSACNAQPWHIILVDEPEQCERVADAIAATGMNKFAWEATAHLVIVEERPNFTSWFGGIIKNKHFPHIDCGILASYITLAATAEGLGSCIVGWFDEKAIRKALNIPSSKRVLLDITLGYTTAPLRTKSRKELEQIASDNDYKRPLKL